MKTAPSQQPTKLLGFTQRWQHIQLLSTVLRQKFQGWDDRCYQLVIILVPWNALCCHMQCHLLGRPSKIVGPLNMTMRGHSGIKNRFSAHVNKFRASDCHRQWNDQKYQVLTCSFLPSLHGQSTNGQIACLDACMISDAGHTADYSALWCALVGFFWREH